MFNFKKSAAALSVAACLGLSLPALADDSKGFIAGQSTTSSGNTLAEVEVVIVNLETGLSRTTTSDSEGNFKFPLLPPGNYSVEGRKNGFLVVQQNQLFVAPSGKTNIELAFESGDMERISVTGATVSAIDTSSSESQLVINQDFLARVPVPRDITSVALLAPGVVSGDSDFGNLASFGGSSVGENTFYVNGLNVTNFRNGLGGSELPFEMYETFQVKTGGYSAEFGRSTGGVINTTTKSGSNDFKWGASAYYEPSDLREQSPDVFRTDAADIEAAGSEYYRVNNRDDVGETNVNVWASGAIIEDKLFFFGLLNQKIRESNYVSDATSTIFERDASDTFYAAKIDWYITEDHILEVTAWDNTSNLETEQNLYDPDSLRIGEDQGDYTLERGGSSFSVKYTGILTDDLTISALYGENEASYSNLNVGANPLGDAPVVYERFSGRNFGQFGLFTPTIQHDKRTAYRFDVDWYVHDDHTLRFGLDYEDMTATENTQRAGGVAYRYEGCDTGLLATGQLDCTAVRQEFYINNGDFQTKSNAIYIEDTWQISDDIIARIGLRNESFENFNKAGEKFVDVTNQIAPRLGISWDVMGDGESKAYANFGRYFLPVATNTNVRLAGDELYTRQLYEVVSIDSNFVPTLGEPVGGMSVFSDGTLKGTTETVNADLDPMYQDEYIVGYERTLNDTWSMGIKGTYRELGSSLEDIAIDKGFNDYLEREFGSSCEVCSGFHYYVLTNPGNPVTITTDPDGDAGPLAFDTYTISAEDLAYPVAERQYAAIDLTLNRGWDDVWQMNFTYTWSHSWGNNEGFVRSDNDQDDSGLTTNFDQPGLTDGANGNLPNDRRHAVKINGAYQVTENLSLGSNFRWTTGRPLNSFGHHPTDAFASLYGAEAFVKDGELVYRGSEGRTSNTWNLDLSAKYSLDISEVPIILSLDIYNVFNNHKVTQQNEVNDRFDGYGDSDSPLGFIQVGEPDPTYGLATNFQTPRYVRFGVKVDF